MLPDSHPTQDKPVRASHTGLQRFSVRSSPEDDLEINQIELQKFFKARPKEVMHFSLYRQSEAIFKGPT